MAIGKKYGGRARGTPNKTTIQKEAIAAALAQRSGHKLLKDILADIANQAYQLSLAYAPHRNRDPEKDKGFSPPADEMKCRAYLTIALHAAASGAPYQSPKLQSTALRDDAPDEPIEVKLVIVERKTPMLELHADDVSERSSASS